MKDGTARGLRDLPAVDLVLKTAAAEALRARFGRAALTDAVRSALDEARAAARGGAPQVPGAEEIVARASARLEAADRPSLRPVFNLTGVVLHTNLGRAILAEAAVEAATAAMRQAVALEFDVEAGRRGERDDHVRELLCALTGAEDATVVNNNAAAVLLVLNSLTLGREAIVSRGELIEIGAAFRLPDIMARAGARLVEVGTTNRTHPRDYAEALGPETGAILKVHTSNYRIQGFTAEVDIPALAEIARPTEVPVVHDLGSGTLIDLSPYGLEKEPTVREALAAGADLVTFSGDKLLGGPQAGYIVGRRELIARINRNPMKRALRVDKLRLAAIEATLKLYRDPDRLSERLPTARFLARAREDVEAQARRLLPSVAAAVGDGFEVEVCTRSSEVGSGALPLATLPSAGIAIRPVGRGGGVERLAARLRGLSRPVIGRIEDDALRLDLRCLDDEAGFLSVVAELAGDGAASGGGRPPS
jgi:L-seryl-tRNA(Ser) seleniumtransferase